ncbi:P-II family nitrogen regulator [Rubritalea tangerina]|uniref:P-II family nitrogen regulator n=1 Tax=Rubritalea tangerina TaxID=430798 RepID=A0ABW4ZDA0_9BACT
MNVPMKKVTIVAERLLKEPILKLIKQHGSTGYTLIACEGEGSRGVHASDWEGRNIQVETIVSPDNADAILDAVCDGFTDHYAVIAYHSDVIVRRKNKFQAPKNDSQ